MMDFLCKWWDFSHKKNVSQGFNKLRRCCCRWSGLDTYDFSDFRLKSEGMWGVYSYNIPIGDCMLYTMVYGVINCWFILIKSLYLFTWNRFLQQLILKLKIDVKFHLATPPLYLCRWLRDSFRRGPYAKRFTGNLSGGPTAMSLGREAGTGTWNFSPRAIFETEKSPPPIHLKWLRGSNSMSGFSGA